MSTRLEKAVPLIALGAVLIVLAIVFLPGLIRQFTFKRDLNRFIELVKAGEAVKAADFVAPEDHAKALDLIDSYIPPDYYQDLAALNVRGYEYIDGVYVCVLVFRFSGERYRGIGQARLRWRRTPDGWRFRLSDAEVAEGYPEGDFIPVQGYFSGSAFFGY